MRLPGTKVLEIPKLAAQSMYGYEITIDGKPYLVGGIVEDIGVRMTPPVPWARVALLPLKKR